MIQGNRINLRILFSYMMDKRHTILITGTHRSGTTWIGKTLDFSRSVEYLGEPFNTGKHNPYISYQFKRWFAYVPEMEREELTQIYKAFKLVFEKRATVISRYRRMIAEHQGDITLQHYLKFTGLALLRNRVLLKDPIALRSAEWLADQFDMKVICTIRHPLRFVSSLKKWDMAFDFNHLLDGGELKDQRLKPFEEKIQYYANNEQDIVSQACLLWNVLNHIIKHYKQTRADWYFVRFEDISKEPVIHFRKLYEFADLHFTKKIEKQVEIYTKSVDKNDSSPVFKPRNSKKNLHTWKDRLTQQEVEQVRLECRDLLNYFYPKEKD